MGLDLILDTVEAKEQRRLLKLYETKEKEREKQTLAFLDSCAKNFDQQSRKKLGKKYIERDQLAQKQFNFQNCSSNYNAL